MRPIALALLPTLLVAAPTEIIGTRKVATTEQRAASREVLAQHLKALGSLRDSLPNPKAPQVFPFKIHQKTLPNGLKIAVIPTGMPGLVSLYIPVSTGSRNEVEPGKSGFAHFFEHMMFRGTRTVNKEKWNLTIQETGAAQNAYTSDDLTNYHTTMGKEDLETWLRLEADRFQNLEYPESEFKDESRAVLGEYNKNSANPVSKLFEVMRDAAFTTHPYKHTTMGFLKDIEDMPNQFKYSREFFHRWYRPDNVTVILVGDVKPETAFPMVEKYFGPWKRVAVKTPVVPPEPEAKGPVSAHVVWATPTLPWMTISFHTPARFSTVRNDSAALALASQLLFGPQSELYQRLVVKEQKVDQFFADGGGAKDPELFTIAARVKHPEDMAYVREAILNTCAQGAALPFSASKLEDAKTEARLGFARALGSSDDIAGMVSRLTAFDRDPEAVLKVTALEETVTPRDLARIAQATFLDRNRVDVTLSHEPLPASVKAAVVGVDARALKLAALPQIALLEEPSASPLVDLRLVFRAGSINDPAGKEGLAALAAAMISDAGTRDRALAELTKAYAATGSGLGHAVDKERTTFSLTVAKSKAPEALELALEQLTETGFREEDFTRLKAQCLNELTVGLKANNDEELGKLALEGRIYTEPFAHPVLGTTRGLEAITLEEVKAFIRAHYTRKNLACGLAGGYAPEQKVQMLRGLAKLPEGAATTPGLPVPAALPATRVQIIAKDTRATAISFGFPIAVDRHHPDFAALWVASSYLGQHRESTARLYQRLRELRGLNYGDYAYIEAFPFGMFKFQPDPGTTRSLNHFQVWIRPVAPQNAAFALKGTLYEMDKLLHEGMNPGSFKATRTFLVKHLATSPTPVPSDWARIWT